MTLRDKTISNFETFLRLTNSSVSMRGRSHEYCVEHSKEFLILKFDISILYPFAFDCVKLYSKQLFKIQYFLPRIQ